MSGLPLRMRARDEYLTANQVGHALLIYSNVESGCRMDSLDRSAYRSASATIPRIRERLTNARFCTHIKRQWNVGFAKPRKYSGMSERVSLVYLGDNSRHIDFLSFVGHG
jgi:hypothetical protein